MTLSSEVPQDSTHGDVEPIELPLLNDRDSIGTLVASMVNGLKYSPDDSFNDNYCRIRAILRRHPLLKDKLPKFLCECTTVEQYCDWMGSRFENSFEWDAHLNNAMAQLASLATSGEQLKNYEIKHELGRGGFGRVFLAEHKLTQRSFAIKFYQPVFHDGGGTPLSRFFQEASMLYDLNHPNITMVREIGLYKERPFIVMDYFESLSLNKALIVHGKMPPWKAIRMTELVTSALKHAHQNGIVHRDLTPGNILLARDDCRVIDFGLGIYVKRALTSRLSHKGETPAGGHFTARELSANPELVDPRTDIYSIGAVWYHAVTNEYPAGAELAKSIERIEGLPSSHGSAILRCLADIDNRFQSCKELLDAIGLAKGDNSS